MALENNLVVDSDAELKAFLSSILSSEGIVVNINRTFIAYNNGTNRNRVFARCANRMAQKGTDEKFVVIALMCYPALNWILKARDIDAMIEQLHDMDTDGSVRNISEIQSLLENSTGYVKPRLHLEMRKLFFARCQQLVDAVDDAMNRAVFRSAQPCKPARISLAMAMLRGSILDSDPVSAVMIRNNFDGIIEDITKVGGEAIKELILQLAPNEGVVHGAEAAYLYHNTEVLLREYSRITHPSSVDGNSTLRLIATAGNQLDASDHKSDTRRIVLIAAGFFVAGYFVVEYLGVVQRAKDGKYVTVKALAVSADQQRDMTGIKETWRFVPVDEEGNPLRDTASHDIFLTVKQKDRDYHIGGTYNMLFCLEGDKGMNNETLVSIEQCFPASSTAKKAQEPVQEQTATQEVGASVKKVNFQNVTNKPKLIVLDNRNRKQDGDTE